MSSTDPAANNLDPLNPPTHLPKPVSAFVQPIVATPNRGGYYIKRLVIAGAVIAFAVFFLYDGFKRYPEHNVKRAQMVAERDAAEAAHDDTTLVRKEKEIRDFGNAKSDFDILLQKIIGFAMLPLGFYLLIAFLRESRGELRLETDTLYAPNHPPVPITSITGVENARWDKKGIAYFDYRLADGTTGRIKIDDFVFDRPPTDAIHDELIAKMPKTEEV